MSVCLSVCLYVCLYLSVCVKVGVYFPVDVADQQTYGCVRVKLLSVDAASHSNIVIRDFLLTPNKTQVSSQ